MKPTVGRPPPMPTPERTAVRRRPALQPIPVPKPYNVDDDDIGRSIRRGIEFLAGKFDNKTKRLGEDPGHNVLAVYALLQAGLAVHDERLNPRGELGARLLDGVAATDLSGYPLSTYTRGVRATCLTLFDRPQDRHALTEDVRVLTSGHLSGGYGYDADLKRIALHADNSNSQFGVLGVWAGADAGVDVPDEYWRTIERYWEGKQTPEGGWSYYSWKEDQSEQSLSMSAAGVASLFVARPPSNG
jgi:hypothetical protein